MAVTLTSFTTDVSVTDQVTLSGEVAGNGTSDQLEFAMFTNLQVVGGTEIYVAYDVSATPVCVDPEPTKCDGFPYEPGNFVSDEADIDFPYHGEIAGTGIQLSARLEFVSGIPNNPHYCVYRVHVNSVSIDVDAWNAFWAPYNGEEVPHVEGGIAGVKYRGFGDGELAPLLECSALVVAPTGWTVNIQGIYPAWEGYHNHNGTYNVTGTWDEPTALVPDEAPVCQGLSLVVSCFRCNGELLEEQTVPIAKEGGAGTLTFAYPPLSGVIFRAHVLCLDLSPTALTGGVVFTSDGALVAGGVTARWDDGTDSGEVACTP